MDRKEFTEAIKAEASKRGEVIIQTINRTDNHYEGLCIKVPAGVPSPVVNLDSLYSHYAKGEWDMERCYKFVNEVLDMSSEQPFAEILNWETAKNMLFLRPFHYVEDGLYEKVEDIFFVPYLQLSEDGATLTRVVPGLMKNWGVDEKTIFDTAKENQERIRPLKITSIPEFLRLPAVFPFFSVSTTNDAFGAGAILYSGVEEKLRDLVGEDFFIIPASVHEMLVIPKSIKGDVDELVEGVTQINLDHTGAEDMLANSIYEFVDGKFRKAG